MTKTIKGIKGTHSHKGTQTQTQTQTQTHTHTHIYIFLKILKNLVPLIIIILHNSKVDSALVL